MIPGTGDAWRLDDAAATHELGKRLGAAARGGEFFALCGPLGAGKTALVQGLAAGLGVPPDEPVVSPTFVLVREYVGRLRLFHLDAYRLGSSEELLSLGFEEMAADPGAVVALEWAERVPDAIPPGATWIELSYSDNGQTREVTIGPSPFRRRRPAVDEPGLSSTT